MSTISGVSCDGGCGQRLTQTSPTRENITAIRRQARVLGWHTTRGEYPAVNGQTYGYTRDICPGCWSGGKR